MKRYPRRQQKSKAEVDDNRIRRVFISYSHDSPEHGDATLALSDRLRADGIDAILDQYEESPLLGWPYWMDEQIRLADYVLIVCTEAYRRHVEHFDSRAGGKGVLWECNIIYNYLYTDRLRNKRFLPLLLAGASPENIPTPLKGYTYFRPDTPAGYDLLYRQLVGEPFVKRPPLGRIRSLPKRADNAAKPPIPVGTEKTNYVLPPRLNTPFVPDPLFSRVKKEVIASAELPSSAMEDGAMNKSEGRSFLSEKLNLNLSHWRYPWNSSKVATMLLVDLDKLSQINQHFAHRIGNAVLYTVYQILRHSQADFSGRCGDDTFYAIFLQVPADRTEQLAEILCHDIGTYGWDIVAAGLSVTCSIGVAHYDKEEPPIDWPVRAAIGMRRAKEKGGNQVSPGPAMLPLANGSYRVSRNLADYFS